MPETIGDFGQLGKYPTHPRLIDWLAVEFRQRKWSMKQMHRLIVTSATYRQSSRATPELLETLFGEKMDPEEMKTA